MEAALEAIPPKPKNPAIIATIKNTTAQYNIKFSFRTNFDKLLFSSICFV